MTVQEFIEFIVDLANDELYEKLDGDARNYFLNGGCYELAKIVKKYVDRCQIVINKSNDHCAILYQGKIYDANGENPNKLEFFIANKEDLEYMEGSFGIPEVQYVNGIRISDFLINAIKECNIVNKLQLKDKEER